MNLLPTRSAGGGGHAGRLGGRVEHVRDGGGELARPLRAGQQAGFPGHHQVWHRVHGGRYHRHAGGHGLGDRARQALVPARHDEHVEPRQQLCHIVAVAQADEAVAEAAPLRPCLELAAQRAVPDPDRVDVRPAERGYGVDEALGCLLVVDPADRADYLAPDGHSQPAACGGAHRRAARRIGALDGRVDHPDAVGCRDPPAHGLGRHRPAHGKEDVGEAAEVALYADVRRPARPRLELVKREAMEGVDHPGDAGPRRRHPARVRRLSRCAYGPRRSRPRPAGR